MKDANGRSITLGDRVQLSATRLGTVVCAFEDAQFSARFPQSEWGYLAAGALIEADDGNLIHYPEADEDLMVVSHIEGGMNSAATGR